MEPDEDEFDPRRGPVGRGILIGVVFGVIAWWVIYELVVTLIGWLWP